MIKLFCAAVFTVLLSGSIYEISIEKADGTTVSLNQYQANKMLVVVLPSQQTEAGVVFLHQLDSVSKVHTDYQFIGVPSYEDGYTDAATGVQAWYSSLVDSQVTITTGMYTRKTSGSQQHPLFAWLTNTNGNGSFDEDVRGVGSKFFINESGELIGELWGDISFSSPLMQRAFR